jgi:hypothetical protein
VFCANGPLGHSAARQLGEALHGVRLSLAQRRQIFVDVLDQGGVFKGAHQVFLADVESADL